ncbi:MAG: potassium transporter Kup [Planctomycetota bacterium]
MGGNDQPRSEKLENPQGGPSGSTRLSLLTLGALGIVYGDIGTSPLYAMRACFQGAHGIPVSQDNVLGVLSLIFWSLVVVVSVKYLMLVMRADNQGEGGVLALMVLSFTRGGIEGSRSAKWILPAGLLGASFLYGDGVITPAISVLSAVEGLELSVNRLAPYVAPITLVILVVLFAVQRLGTGRIGRVSGPVMLVWFVTIGLLGACSVARTPGVLCAMNPACAVGFLIHDGWRAAVILSAVFLVVTGAEALYADMGHFGERPIRLAWFTVVLPALLLNYFGQGALLLSEPLAVENPFYRLSPGWGIYPLIGLSTLAAVIASQAVISGVFSLTRQAVQLDYLPRMEIVHTSTGQPGQVYAPSVNWIMLITTIGLVLGFRSSSGLAAAYGIAVSATMVITTVLASSVAVHRWSWTSWKIAIVFIPLLFMDTAFFSANLAKLLHGGWFPLAAAGLVYLVMSTWWQGRRQVMDRLREAGTTVESFLERLEREGTVRVPGTAVYLAKNARDIPPALLHNVRHYGVIHENVVLLTVKTLEVPFVREEERVEVSEPAGGLARVIARYGFKETPDLSTLLRKGPLPGRALDPTSTPFFLSRIRVIVGRRPGLVLWRKELFIFLRRFKKHTTLFFRIPPEQVIEVGIEVEL